MRKKRTELVTPVPSTSTNKGENTEFQDRRQALEAWRQVDKHIYSKSSALTGGTNDVNTNSELGATVTVASLNVRGLTNVKLELALQSFVAEEWDVLFLIDTQLDKKGGDYMGKKIKRRLGTGTRTHVCPCILDYGTDDTGGFCRAGGILVVIGILPH